MTQMPAGTASHDYQVRLSRSETAALVFAHVMTQAQADVLDDARAAGVHATAAGITEWAAVHQRGRISLGWDWVLLSDGPAILRVAAPRTNLVVLDDKGYDTHDPSALFELAQGIAWQAAVLKAA